VEAGLLYNAIMLPVYLDSNATTPLLPEAWEAMEPALRETYGNPSSAHSVGRKARQLLEESRENIASMLGAFPDEIVFTSGATEANNLALFGLAAKPVGSQPSAVPDRILASPIEHPCVVEPLRQLESRGIAIDWLPVSAEGIVPSGYPSRLIRAETNLVSVMLVNHETGAIQPVRAIARNLPASVLMHTDAAQAVGRMTVNFHELGVAALTASAHKFGGPKGVGLLLLKRGTRFHPSVFGGHQQQGRRPGTEPVALAAGMAAALQHAVRNMAANLAKRASLRFRLWEQLSRLAAPVVLNGPPIGSPDSLPATLNVSFPGCRGDLLLMALDLAGIACSTGSACSSGSLLASPVLQAMGVSEDLVRAAIRFSFGIELELESLDGAAERIAEVVCRIRE
jgi:cysteine desulfurase